MKVKGLMKETGGEAVCRYKVKKKRSRWKVNSVEEMIDEKQRALLGLIFTRCQSAKVQAGS